MHRAIVGIGVVLIVIGIFGVGAEGFVFSKAYSKMGEGGQAGASGIGALLPDWIKTAITLFVIYQILMPIAVTISGVALVQIGRKMSSGPSKKRPFR